MLGLADPLRHHGIHGEAGRHRVNQQLLGAGQRRILQALEDRIDVLLECLAGRLGFIGRMLRSEVLDVHAEGGGDADENARVHELSFERGL